MVPKFHFFYITVQNMEIVPANCCKLNALTLMLYISCPAEKHGYLLL